MEHFASFLPYLLAFGIVSLSNHHGGHGQIQQSGPDPAHVEADPDYARNIFSSFSSYCPSNGNWTQSALRESRKIEKVLVALRDDPRCQLAAETLSIHLNSLEESLRQIDMNRPTKKTISRMEREQLDILLQIEELREKDKKSDEIDHSEEIHQLEQRYQERQLELALDKGDLEFDEEYIRNTRLAKMAVESTGRIFEQMTHSQQCLFKYPEFLSSISSIGANLGSALSGTGVNSLIFAASAHVFGSVLTHLRKSNINKDIFQLSLNEFINAHQCVLESLSNQWCEAYETRDLIKLKVSSHPEIKSDFLSRGIKILSRDLPVLISWLKMVRSAAEPVNSSISERQVMHLKSEVELEAWKLKSLGALIDAVDNLPESILTSEEKSQQFNILKNTISSMIPGSHGGGDENYSNPILELRDPSRLAWDLSGIPLEDIPTGYDDGYVDFQYMTESSFIENDSLFRYYPLSPDMIKKKIYDIYEETFEHIIRNRSKFIHVDPEFLFVEFEDVNYSGVSGIKNHSPAQAIDNILNYFQFQQGGAPPCHSYNDQSEFKSNFDKLYAQTMKILCTIREQVYMVSIGSNYNERLLEIYTVSNLNHGETFIKDRIENIIRTFLHSYLLENKNDESLFIRQKLLLVDDVVRDLTLYGNNNLSLMMSDIENALRILKDLIQNYVELFADSLDITIRQLHYKSKEDPLAGNTFAKYCSLLLSIPDWSSPSLKDIDLSLCESVALKSLWGEEDFSFPLDLYKSSNNRNIMEERKACHYRRFLRHEFLKQNYYD